MTPMAAPSAPHERGDVHRGRRRSQCSSAVTRGSAAVLASRSRQASWSSSPRVARSCRARRHCDCHNRSRHVCPPVEPLKSPGPRFRGKKAPALAWPMDRRADDSRCDKKMCVCVSAVTPLCCHGVRTSMMSIPSLGNATMDSGPDVRQAMRLLTRERLTCCWQLNASGVPEMIWTRALEDQPGINPADVLAVRAMDRIGASNAGPPRRRLAA
jgi:hypothetical protein